MKIRLVLLIPLILLASCAKDAAGKLRYVGPRISGSLSLKGVTISATVYAPVTDPLPIAEAPSIVPRTIPPDGKEVVPQ